MPNPLNLPFSLRHAELKEKWFSGLPNGFSRSMDSFLSLLWIAVPTISGITVAILSVMGIFWSNQMPVDGKVRFRRPAQQGLGWRALADERLVDNPDHGRVGRTGAKRGSTARGERRKCHNRLAGC
jgi:hypothetical protein